MKWRRRLKILIKGGSSKLFAEAAWDIDHDAATWSNCYIGENISKLKKAGFKFEPGDIVVSKQITKLGMDFMFAVQNDEYKKALKIADKVDALIEKRMKK